MTERKTPATALSQKIATDWRRVRAQRVTAHIMHIVGKHIPDDPDGGREAAWRDLYATLYEADAEILSRAQINEYESYRQAILDWNLTQRMNTPIFIPLNNKED